jgi:hypothetical protein
LGCLAVATTGAGLVAILNQATFDLVNGSVVAQAAFAAVIRMAARS